MDLELRDLKPRDAKLLAKITAKRPQVRCAPQHSVDSPIEPRLSSAPNERKTPMDDRQVQAASHRKRTRNAAESHRVPKTKTHDIIAVVRRLGPAAGFEHRYPGRRSAGDRLSRPSGG